MSLKSASTRQEKIIRPSKPIWKAKRALSSTARKREAAGSRFAVGDWLAS